MRFAVCDDGQKFVDQAIEALQSYMHQRGEACECEGFTAPEALLARCAQTLFDAIVLDIDMPNKNGIDTAREVRKFQPNTPVIFVTSLIQYAPESLKVNAFRYVLKQDFAVAFPDALDALWEKLFPPRHVLCLKTDSGKEEFELEKIITVEVQGRTLKLRLVGREQPVCTRGPSLKKLAEELEPQGFLRLQKSYLANMQHIRSISSYVVTMDNGDRIKASERQYRAVKQRYVLWKGERL